ncbi:hypothetical protein Vadar_033093 [Vaccinium darrowii]|uniref:Uncharacterized protein n=1 Tax=Vaccinium darrowii TaxID=229202 RepID=A0ACB7XE36_9ERIC|nr:hypothetical protein Vadar_033093 [Vaccinium darrowii]
MEHSLSEAAITGNIDSLHEIIKKDALLLDKFAAGCFDGPSPLHVAASKGQLHFVEELLRLQPDLTEVLDSQQRSALHLASAKGHDEIVKVLVKANPEMCLVRDRDGKNPLHVAAARGRLSVLHELVGTCPEAARVRAKGNDTILHLCVKHNQLESLRKLLELIHDWDFVNAKDNDGNTILHLAILHKRLEITRHVLNQKRVLKKKIIDVNATNASEHTAMDIFFLVHGGSDRKNLDRGESDQKKLDRGESDQKQFEDIEDLLLEANGKRAKDLAGGDWLSKKKDSLMVVASLIATMAFQAAVNPPGGVWQDDSHGHRAGEAVMAYNYQQSYPYFLRFNTIGFVASLSTLLLLISGLKFRNKATMWILVVSMWVAITSMAITYAFSNVVVTPKKHRQSLSYTIKTAVIAWTCVMALLLLRHTYYLVAMFVKEKQSRMKAMKRIMNFKPKNWCSLHLVLKLLGVRDRATTSLPVATS